MGNFKRVKHYAQPRKTLRELRKCLRSKGHGMANDSWETPDYIFYPLNEIFKFDCDVAASAASAKCDKFFSERYSAFSPGCQWGKMNWCNNPYSRGSMKLFVEESLWWMENGSRTVMLPKGDTSTDAFKKTWGLGGHYFYYKRIKFKDAQNCAEFPSCLVFFGNLTQYEIQALKQLGQGEFVAW